MPNIKIKSITDRKGEELSEEKISEKRPGKFKKMFKWLFIFLLILISGGVSGVAADRFLVPYFLAVYPSLEKYEFLKPKETEVIVKEKETVRIEESSIINEAINKAKPALVTILPKESKEKDSSLKIPNLGEYGSGFVVTSDGLIVTSKVVVKDIKAKYIVFTEDGKNFESEEIFSDPASDLIFLKVEADNLTAASIGISDDLILGQKIITLGRNLNDFQDFASTGVINSLDFSIFDSLNEEKLDQMIKVEAEINSVNSGGPMIDLSGKIYGINVEYSEEGRVKSYVIPSDTIKKPLEEVIKNKEIKRPKLGIKYIKNTPYLAYQENLAKDFGIFLPQGQSAVDQKGEAYKAGLKEGDLIYAISNKEIKNKQNLVKILEDYKVGDEILVKYLREGKEGEIKVKLGE